MHLFHAIARFIDPKPQLFARFWQSASLFWRVKNTRATVLVIFLIAVVVLQLLLQVLLNLWNRHFFDALERRDSAAVWVQMQTFVPLAAASIALAAASVWGRMTTQRSWREQLTRHVIERWLRNERYKHLNHFNEGSENPEYRIGVDARVATDAPIDLTLALFSSIITALTFFGVLWNVGGSLDIPLFGQTMTIPGYLVIGVILYSGLMSSLMILVGHQLTGVIEHMNQAEAEFREAADAYSETHRHEEPGSEATLWHRLRKVLRSWRVFCWQLVRTTVISHGNMLCAPVVAWALCVPKYLSGAMSLGELTQTAAAFVTVQGAFNWLVDNYQRLADWRSSANRVATLLIAIDELEALETSDKAPPEGSVTPS